MDNASIADVFDELAELLEFRGENPFRIRAYRAGARAIRDLDEPVAGIVDDPDRDLADLAGIGKTLAEKTAELLSTGTLNLLTELRAAVPDVVIEMSRIPGLGAKKASRLHTELAINSLDELRTACEDGRIASLKGFGKKTAQSILDGLSIAIAANQRITWAASDDLAASIADHLDHCDAIKKFEFAGSYRRGRETVGDLDVVVVADDHAAVMDHFEAYIGRTQTIGRGDTKVSIRIGKSFQVDMRVVLADQFGAALQYFTGSQAHNIHVRRLAKERGLKINEYGVFTIDDDAAPPAGQSRGEHSRAGTHPAASEEDVYAAIGLPWIDPELREDRHEFELAAKHQLPKLIELGDIRGDLHMHTHASDGNASIREMADAAIARGMSYIAITDHSQRVSMARGLTPLRLREQWKLIDEIRPEYEGRLVILKGIECDILEAGGMDLPDDCLAEADWVLASVHYGQRQSREQITDRILGAVANSHVSCIAHPTGRLINRRPPYDVDLEAVMVAAAANGTLLELNANPSRLDLNDIHLAAARRHGIPIVISTDAHSTDGMGVMRYGIKQARRGGLTAADVINTRSVHEFLKR